MARRSSDILNFRCRTCLPWPIVVAGNLPQLGNWDPNTGLPLQVEVNTGGRREWVGSEAIPDGTRVEFKFVAKTDRGLRWESGENRVVIVGQDEPAATGDFRE